MDRRITHGLINFLLAVGSVLFVLGAMEIALLIMGIGGRSRTPPIYQTNANPAISYELKPNLQETAFRATVTTNKLGMRSPEPDPSKESIALLGDSITFGYGLQDNETLGARISADLSEKFNVLNAAVPGYNLIQEAATYQEKIAPLTPKTLILVFYWNDLQDMSNAVLDSEGILRQPGWKPEDATCNPIETGLLGYLPGRCWFDLHSALYRTVKKIVSARQEQKNLAVQQEEAANHPEQDTISPEKFVMYRDTFLSFTNTLPIDQQKIFVIWPDKEFHPKILPQLITLAQSQGFRVVNLYDVFGNKAETLSWDTVHPSAQTVLKAAEVITTTLQGFELPPR